MEPSQTESVSEESRDRFSLLQSHYLFTCLQDSQLQQIAKTSRFISIDVGEMLFCQGDEALHFYLVIDGQIKLCLGSRDGGQKIVEVVYPGQTFAEAIAFMAAHRYPVSAQAIEKSRLLSIPSEIYLEILAGSTEACFRLLGDVSRRLHARLGEIENLTLQNASHRLVRFFLQKLQPGSTVVVLDLSRQDIASRLSIKPETLSRLIRGLVDSGVIAVDGKTVTILDYEALSHFE